MKLLKIKLQDLETFCSGDIYQNSETKPISPLRVKSYLANPRAKPDDMVLYILLENEKIIAFLTVLPDTACSEDNIPVRFGWGSTAWVDPKYRGKKLSRLLTENAMEDWECRLMFTNYAPEIETLYTQNNLYRILQHRKGCRFYFYPDFNEILGKKYPSPILKPLFTLSNIIAKYVSDIKRAFARSIKLMKLVEIEFPDKECMDWMSSHADRSFFKRGEKEIDWIFKFPWVTEENYPEFEYPFSFDRIKQRIRTVKYYTGDTFTGFFIYSMVNRKMKVLYHYEIPGPGMLVTIPIIKTAIKNKISHLTILESLLASKVKDHSEYFLFGKPYHSHIYSTFDIVTEGKQIFDGDGDNCFT